MIPCLIAQTGLSDGNTEESVSMDTLSGQRHIQKCSDLSAPFLPSKARIFWPALSSPFSFIKVWVQQVASLHICSYPTLEPSPLSCQGRQCRYQQEAAGECQLNTVEIRIRQFCKGPGHGSVNLSNSRCQSRNGCHKRKTGQEMPALIQASGVADPLVGRKVWPPWSSHQIFGPQIVVPARF